MRRLIFTLVFLSVFGLTFAQTSISFETNIYAMSIVGLSKTSPLNDTSSLVYNGSVVIGTGFGYGSNGIKAEVGLSSFGPKHFVETTAVYLYGFEEEASIGFKLGYRYQTNKNLMLLANTFVLSNLDPVVLPSIGVGFKL